MITLKRESLNDYSYHKNQDEKKTHDEILQRLMSSDPNDTYYNSIVQTEKIINVWTIWNDNDGCEDLMYIAFETSENQYYTPIYDEENNEYFSRFDRDFFTRQVQSEMMI